MKQSTWSLSGILELQRLATGEPDRDPGREPEPPCGRKSKVKLKGTGYLGLCKKQSFPNAIKL